MIDLAPARGSFDALLAHLAEVPRENGTAAIHRSAEFLRESLAAAGVDVELVPFVAHPYGLRLAGVLALCGALLYARLAATGRHAVALGVAILVPTALVLDLDYGVPIFSWIGSQTQHHVVARVAARQPARQLLFTAHYDTKTDALDHVERAPVEMAAPLAVLVMVAGALAGLAAARQPRRRRKLELASRIARAVAVVYGLAAFVVYSAGAFVPERSPGALDDGAATAVLVRLAAELAEGPPPARTGVEVVLFSAEEVGVQGSRVFAAERFRDEPALPTLVINLEGIGGSERHAVLGFERFTLRSYPAAPAVVELLDAAHRRVYGDALAITPFGGATDARSFLARGIPAATLVSRADDAAVPRGLHSAGDDRTRIDVAALAGSLEFLREVVRVADAREP